MNRARRLGLQAWLGAAFVLLGAIASITAVLVVLPNLEGPIRQEEFNKVKDDALAFLDSMSLSGQTKSDAVQSARLIGESMRADVRLTQIRDGKRRALFRSLKNGYLDQALTPAAAEIINSTENESPVVLPKQVGGQDVVQGAVTVLVDDREAVFELGLPVGGTAKRLALVRRRVLLAISLVLALALVSGLAISRVLGARMRRLAGTAATLAMGDLSARAQPQSPAEIASLAGSLNTMASRLEGLVDETVSDRDRAQGLVASLAEGVLAVSDRGEITVANDAARALLTLPADLSGTTIDQLPDAVRQAWDEARDGHEDTSVVEASLSGGIHLLLQASYVSREAGVVITIRDVTEERRLNRARRDLIANVSHELKTPLTAVKGFLELLESDHMNPEQRTKFLGLMNQEVLRLERLIAEQLELARIDAGALPLDRGPHDLGALAEDVAASRRHLAELNGITMRASIPPTPVIANVDPARVEQILLILLDNAIKHTPDGGQITVAVGEESKAALLSVRDTGDGIPAEAQPFIFDRFYQADQSREGTGLGLGLSIARGLAEAHGGAVDVRSAQGVGSVFIVRLPLEAAPQPVAGVTS